MKHILKTKSKKYWTISKVFEADYGHRVWTQTLDPKYTLDSCLACRHNHGHRMQVEVFLRCKKLNKQGMVIDFKYLNWFKKWLDDTVDHKFILDINDPALTEQYPDWILNRTNDKLSTALVFNPKSIVKGFRRELYEGLIVVPFVPTSENLAWWFHSIIQRKMKPLGVKVLKVQFNETPKSQSTFTCQ